MAVRVAINGFGRIGRNVLRAIIENGREDIEVTLDPFDTLAGVQGLQLGNLVAIVRGSLIREFRRSPLHVIGQPYLQLSRFSLQE